MDFVINFTELKNTAGNINKKLHIEPNGKFTKTPNAQISQGVAKTIALTPLQFVDYLNNLSSRSDTCLVTGIWADGYKNFAEYDITVAGKEDPDNGLISRTQNFFKYLNSDSISFMVFDIDEDYTIEEIHEFIAQLEKVVPEAIIGSNNLMRFEKPSSSAGVAINGKKLGNGIHIYIPVKNMSEDLLSDIFKWAWISGYAKHKISAAGTILSRSIIDETVKEPNRITFESDIEITGAAELVELVERKCEYYEGGVLDCELARSCLYDLISAFGKKWSDYKHKVEKDPETSDEIKRLKDLHTSKLIANNPGLGSKAAKVTDLLYDRRIILSDEYLTKTDGTKISVYDILTDRDSYINQTHFQDFIDPKPGTNKAMIKGSGIDDNIKLKSFAHGGIYYYLRFTYEDICRWIDEADNDDIIYNVSSFIAQSEISEIQLDKVIKEVTKRDKSITKTAITKELKSKSALISSSIVSDLSEDSSIDTSDIDKEAGQGRIADDMIIALGNCKSYGGYVYVAEKNIWKSIRKESLRDRISNRYEHCKYCKSNPQYNSIAELVITRDKLYCEEWSTPPGIPCLKQFLMVGDNVDGEMSGIPVKGVKWVDYNLDLGCRFKLKFDPDWNCETPYWNKVLNNITNVGCFQQAFGLALSGLLTAKMQKAAVFYGAGGTGKGTINNVLMAMLPRGRVTNMNFTQMSDPKQVVPLAESVINFMTETSRGKKPYALDGFKKATGGDSIQAWLLYRGSVNFKPTATQILNFNDWPRLESSGSDIQRRLGHFIIEFNKNYDEEIIGLVDKIVQHELPGVLAWAIDGIISYFRDGIDDEYSLKLYQRWIGYFDKVALFLRECTIYDRTSPARTSRPALWKIFQKWCEESGFPAGEKSELTSEVDKLCGATMKSDGDMVYHNLDLTAYGLELVKAINLNPKTTVKNSRVRVSKG